MNYYHDLITEKSWKMLQQLKRRHQFIVIGGWAVYLYTKALKSRDIDFICSYEELKKFKDRYELIKNDRLKKYEIHMGEFDVDIYVPYFSDLGIPAEDLGKMTRSVEGFTVLAPEPLLLLKQRAYADRKGSAKGEKDKIDILSLVREAVDIKKYCKLLDKFSQKNLKKMLVELLKETREVPELGLGEHAYSKLRIRVLEQL